MSRQVASSKIFDAVAVSSTNTYYSGSSVTKKDGTTGQLGTDTPASQLVTIVGKFTSTPGGTLTVEVSNSDRNDVEFGVDVWTTYTQVTGSGFAAGVATVTSGQINGSAVFAIELKNFGYRRIRLTYVNASGTGTISAVITVKRA